MALETDNYKNLESAILSVANAIEPNSPRYVHLDGTGFTSFTLSMGGTGAQDTGMKIILPSAGTWQVTAKIRSRISVNGATGRYIRLWLSHNSVNVDTSIANYHAHETVYHTIHNEPMSAIVTTTTSNEEVRIYTAISATTSVTYAKIESDVNGYTTMTAVRLY